MIKRIRPPVEPVILRVQWSDYSDPPDQGFSAWGTRSRAGNLADAAVSRNDPHPTPSPARPVKKKKPGAKSSG